MVWRGGGSGFTISTQIRNDFSLLCFLVYLIKADLVVDIARFQSSLLQRIMYRNDLGFFYVESFSLLVSRD